MSFHIKPWLRASSRQQCAPFQPPQLPSAPLEAFKHQQEDSQTPHLYQQRNQLVLSEEGQSCSSYMYICQVFTIIELPLLRSRYSSQDYTSDLSHDEHMEQIANNIVYLQCLGIPAWQYPGRSWCLLLHSRGIQSLEWAFDRGYLCACLPLILLLYRSRPARIIEDWQNFRIGADLDSESTSFRPASSQLRSDIRGEAYGIGKEQEMNCDGPR